MQGCEITQPIRHPDDGRGKEDGKDDDPERRLVVAGDLWWRAAEVGAEGDPVEVDEVTHGLAKVGEAVIDCDALVSEFILLYPCCDILSKLKN